MTGRTANLLGALGLAVADRIEAVGRQVLGRSGETPAALVVIGYGFGPSNDQLRRVLDLSHPGAVRLVDRLVADGLVERREAADRRANALHLTHTGREARDALLDARLAAIEPLLEPLNEADREALHTILGKILPLVAPGDADRCRTCRLCSHEVCTDCPIPAEFRNREASVEPRACQ